MAKIKNTHQTTKKDIITARASMLFRQKGYKATSMRTLADIVGVEAPSLYNHIANKEELLRSICSKVAEDFTEHLTATELSGASSLQKVEKIIRFHIRMMMERFEDVYVSNHDWHHLEEPYHSEFLKQRKSYAKRFAAIIAEGITTGEIKNLNPHVAVLTMMSAVRGIEFWQRNKRSVSAADVEHDMVVHLLTGLQA